MSLSKIAIVIGIVVPLAVVSSIVQAAAAQGRILQWSRPTNISNSAEESRFVRIAPDLEGNLHAVWSENVEADSASWGNTIYYSQFKQGRWSNPVDVVYNGSMAAHLPSIAASRDGNLSLIWTDTYRLYYQHARAEAAKAATGWSSPKTISFGGQERTYWSDIVIEDNTIHVAWSGSQKGSWDIFYVRSTDSGRTWTAPVRVTDTPNVSETRPRLAVDRNSTVHLMWGQNRDNDDPVGPLMYSRSTDGVRWDSPVPASPFKGSSDLTAIAVDGQNRLHQVWQQGAQWHSSTPDPNQGLYHRWSDDAGRTWTRPSVIARGWSYLSLAVDSLSRLHLVWSEIPGGAGLSLENQDVYYASWDGTHWSAPVQLASTQGDARPQIAVTEGNRLNVVWARSKPDEVYDIFHISAVTDAPALPTRLFPIMAPALQPTATSAPTTVSSPTPLPTRSLAPTTSGDAPAEPAASVWTPMLAGVLPILLLVVSLITIRIVRTR